MSLLLRPKLPPARLAPLTLVAGLCLRDAVEDICAVKVRLKWPNDLLIRVGPSWKKCAGILTELAGQMEQTEWAVVGVGLNVNNTITEELSSRAVSLYGATHQAWPRAELLENFLAKFKTAYARFCKEGFEPFRRPYWRYYYAPDAPVSLNTAGGTVKGIARGVDAVGAIMIEFRRKMHFYTEGEIIL
jgi:BirA family biotin operon repressor/biotin-[acetyl-CoA-carboxylase] ligase